MKLDAVLDGGRHVSVACIAGVLPVDRGSHPPHRLLDPAALDHAVVEPVRDVPSRQS